MTKQRIRIVVHQTATTPQKTFVLRAADAGVFMAKLCQQGFRFSAGMLSDLKYTKDQMKTLATGSPSKEAFCQNTLSGQHPRLSR